MKRIGIVVAFLAICSSLFSQGRYIKTSDDVNLYVTVKGKGIPCLYVHGGPGAGSYWMEKFAGDILESRFQMIYLDQRGTCRSSSPKDGNYSMERMAKDFEEVKEALGIKEWITMGHSFGGILQMGYVKFFPQSTSGMIMICCTLYSKESFETSWGPKACEFLGLKDTALYSDQSIPFMERWVKFFPLLNEKNISWKMQYERKESSDLMAKTFGEVSNFNWDFEGHMIGMDEYFNVSYKPMTSGVMQPVLYFYGTRDWSVGPSHFKGIEFPNMLLKSFNGGHAPFLENRKELENAIDLYLKQYKRQVQGKTKKG